MNSPEDNLSFTKIGWEFLLSITPQELAALLNVSYPYLVNIISHPTYRKFKIPKKKGGHREITAPDVNLSRVQKKLNKYLQVIYAGLNTGNSHGFIKNKEKSAFSKSILSNAKNHIGKKYILNIDIKEFFNSISAVRIREMFRSFPFEFSNEHATCLTLLVCYEKQLPTGAPSSPIISNLFCVDFDLKLQKFADVNELSYSRYADDLTFSSNYSIDNTKVEEIQAIINQFGFEVNSKKLRLRSKNSQQTVTGIVVNEKLNIDRRYIRKIRAILHDIRTNGVELAAMKHYKLKTIDDRVTIKFTKSIQGKMNFIGNVKGKTDAVYNRLREEFAGLVLNKKVD